MMFCGMPNSAIAAEACVGLSSMILCFGLAPEVCSAPLLPKRISSASWIIGGASGPAWPAAVAETTVPSGFD